VPLHFNLHNHSTWSDGAATPRDLAEAAARCGLSHLGISDHFRSTKLEPGRGLDLERLPAYIEELRGLRTQYQGRVAVLAGLEINFSLVQTDFTFLSQFEPGKNPLNRLDYLLLESVGDADAWGLGLEELLRLRPLLQVPVGLAHNDLEKNFKDTTHPEVLAKVLAQAQVFVELATTRRNGRPLKNGGHLPYYRVGSEFNRRFYAACRGEGVKLSIGCDVHADLEELGATTDAARFLAEEGLEANAVIHHLWSLRA